MENKIENKNISISLLGVDKKQEFISKIKEVCLKNNIENVLIHYDIMDEIFVPNRGVDYENVSLASKAGMYADVHLMVENPMQYISKVVALGAKSITVHYEIENLSQILIHLNKLKLQKKIFNVGLAIKPGTTITNLHEYLYLVDMVLVMSVEPGRGGQEYIKEVNEKIMKLKGVKNIIQVDGGVNENTILDAKNAGATSFVIGSYFTKNLDEFEEKLLKINKLI